MPRGQFYTVFTMGFATALGLFGIGAAIACWYWLPAAWTNQLVTPRGGSPATWLSPGVFACFVAGASIFVAHWLVQAQQAIVRRSGDRELAKLNEEYRALVQTLGVERADEIMQHKMLARMESGADHFDIFGRSDLLHSMRVAGALSRQRPTV